MHALRTISLFVAGLLFGFVVDVVAYNLFEGMVCIPDFPSTCFVTQHSALRPIVNALLILIPLTTCVIFCLFQSNGLAQKLAHISLVALVFAVITLAVCANFIHPQSGAIGGLRGQFSHYSIIHNGVISLHGQTIKNRIFRGAVPCDLAG
jgi:hypothetical protein